jgi:HAMP domain-containing protein
MVTGAGTSGWKFKNWRLAMKIVTPLAVITIVASVALGAFIYEFQRNLVVGQARRTGQAIAAQIAAERSVYSSMVIGKLPEEGFQITPTSLDKFRGIKGGVPLPASFVHATSEAASAKGYHTADLLSLWNVNPKKGPRDKFEREALESVAKNPKSIQETVDGQGDKARFKLVTADVASAPACVDCHNHMENSPKKDFKLGDVMGGLVISLPVGKDLAAARSNAFYLTLGGVVMLGLLMGVVGMVQVRYVSKPLSALTEAADQISVGKLDVPVQIASDDEIGHLAAAFERMRESLRVSMERMRVPRG